MADTSADREAVRATLTRQRIVVTGLAGGVLLTAAFSGFVEIGRPIDLAARLSLPAGIASLLALVAAWQVYTTFRDRASDVGDVATGCARYGKALLGALALTEGFAFLGIVVYWLGGGIVALTGVAAHVLLCGVLWPALEKLQPFLGRAGSTLPG